MSNRRAQTRDPVAAVEQLLSSGPRRVTLTLKETFYGPEATFQQAFDDGEPDRVARLQALLPKLNDAVCQITCVPNDRWERLRQLCLIRVGTPAAAEKPDLHFDPPSLAKLLDEAPGTPAERQDCSPLPDEIKYFTKAIDKLRGFGWGKHPPQWTAADWRVVSFFQDTLESRSQSRESTVTERTPVFLANERMGKVLWLVAERLPGPPRLITPHWWRLGLVPLGRRDQLLEAVHNGFLAVLNSLPETRYQIRWWLEAFPGGGGWHEDIDEADSVQVSAACLTCALFDTDAPHPLLDPKAGVSATLPITGGANVNDQIVGDVGYVQEKIEAAERAGILTFLLAPGSVKPDLSRLLAVQSVKTFGDAYDAILATVRPVQDYKISNANEWGMPFLPVRHSTEAKEAEDREASVPGRWVATDTHEDFINASRK